MASEDIPLLDQVRVAAPCRMNWDDMVGGERVRYCRSCELNVYNLSEMSRADAEKLLKTHEGHLCVRYYRRADGKIMSNNCPVGLKAIRRVFLRQTAIVASLAGTLFGGLFAFACKSEPSEPKVIAREMILPTMGSPASIPDKPKPQEQQAKELDYVMGGIPADRMVDEEIKFITDDMAERENALTDKKHPPSASKRRVLEVQIIKYKNALINKQEVKRRIEQLRHR